MAETVRRRAVSRMDRPTIAALLDHQLTEFDELMRDVRGGIRSPDHFDALEARASAIGRALRDAFRRGRVAPF